MSTTWNGNSTPAQDDMWNLVEDMRKQAILNNRVIPVYSKAERDGLSAAAPDGVIPDGTVVVRMDQVAKGAVFDVFADGSWKVGDTGILTSGVSVTSAGPTTIQSYSVSRTGPLVTARVDFTYTGERLEPNGRGNMTDVSLFSFEAGWSPIWATYNVAITWPGAQQFFGRVDSGGLASLTHGIAGQDLPPDTPLRLDGSWRIS